MGIPSQASQEWEEGVETRGSRPDRLKPPRARRNPMERVEEIVPASVETRSGRIKSRLNARPATQEPSSTSGTARSPSAPASSRCSCIVRAPRRPFWSSRPAPRTPPCRARSRPRVGTWRGGATPCPRRGGGRGESAVFLHALLDGVHHRVREHADYSARCHGGLHPRVRAKGSRERQEGPWPG